jgi:nucleotide-binding universal stress UspA family protein
LEKHGITCTPRLIFDGKTAGPAIIDQARSVKAELIIVAARPSLLPKWLRDGVAEYVVGNSSVPVLVIPAEGEFNFEARGNHVDIRSN